MNNTLVWRKIPLYRSAGKEVEASYGAAPFWTEKTKRPQK